MLGLKWLNREGKWAIFVSNGVMVWKHWRHLCTQTCLECPPRLRSCEPQALCAPVSLFFFLTDVDQSLWAVSLIDAHLGKLITGKWRERQKNNWYVHGNSCCFKNWDCHVLFHLLSLLCFDFLYVTGKRAGDKRVLKPTSKQDRKVRFLAQLSWINALWSCDAWCRLAWVSAVYGRLLTSQPLSIHAYTVYTWFNKGCFRHLELCTGKVLFGSHSSKSL